jgi:hypothetical protein
MAPFLSRCPARHKRLDTLGASHLYLWFAVILVHFHALVKGIFAFFLNVPQKRKNHHKNRDKQAKLWYSTQ